MTKDGSQRSAHDNGIYRKFDSFQDKNGIRSGGQKKSPLDLVRQDSIRSQGINDYVTISDVIGGFGWFQLLVLIFSGMREAAVGYDAVVVSTMTQRERKFICTDLEAVEPNWGSNNLTGIEHAQCYVGTTNQHQCQSWKFPERNGSSLITEWSLVCQYEWYVPFMQSLYFCGVVAGNLAWGYWSDKIGRWRASIIGHALSMVFGYAAIFAPNAELFMAFRVIAAFSIISNNILYQIQTEIIGADYRSYSTILNHMGWGLGILVVPFVAGYFDHYRYVLAVIPTMGLIMLPFAFWIPESPRWLMANGRETKARDVLRRVARFNGKRVDDELEHKINQLNLRMAYEKQVTDDNESSDNPYVMLFTNWTLTKDTILLSLSRYLAFCSYYYLTIVYVEQITMEANFIISGIGEWIGCLLGAVMIRLMPRRVCGFIFLMLTGLSFIAQAMSDSNFIPPSMKTQFVLTAINAVGTLCSLMTAFVMILISQEAYPTVMRSTACGIVQTIGEMGSATAPFLMTANRSLGPVTTSIIWAITSIICAIGTLFLTETKDVELEDTIVSKTTRGSIVSLNKIENEPRRDP